MREIKEKLASADTKNYLPRHAWKPCCKAKSVVSLASFDTCVVYIKQTTSFTELSVKAQYHAALCCALIMFNFFLALKI